MRQAIMVAAVCLAWACGSSEDGQHDSGSSGTCTPGPKGTGEPCTEASECASCECEDVDEATKGQFRVCTTKCTNHNQCASGEFCLYPTRKACVLKCTTADDCPSPYNGCDVSTGTYKFCLVQ